MVMGCYGIGVSRVVAAVAEEHHDEHGLAWPAALAPYDVHLIVGARPRRRGRERDRATPTASTTSCAAAGIDVLYDDRDVEPGREVRRRRPRSACRCSSSSARRASARGVVERKVRATGARDELPLDDFGTLAHAVQRMRCSFQDRGGRGGRGRARDSPRRHLLGLPYLDHPDEPTNYGVFHEMVHDRTLNPHFFNYPSLFFDLQAFVHGITGSGDGNAERRQRVAAYTACRCSSGACWSRSCSGSGSSGRRWPRVSC